MKLKYPSGQNRVKYVKYYDLFFNANTYQNFAPMSRTLMNILNWSNHIFPCIVCRNLKASQWTKCIAIFTYFKQIILLKLLYNIMDK